jgi:hypothetical protein
MDRNGKAEEILSVRALVFEHEELPWCAVVLGVLRGENFKSVNRHEHRCPGDADDAPPDTSIRRERRRSGWQSVLSQMRLPCRRALSPANVARPLHRVPIRASSRGFPAGLEGIDPGYAQRSIPERGPIQAMG